MLHNSSEECKEVAFCFASSKTSFGDWSPDKSLWGRYRSELGVAKLDRDAEFLVAFGQQNPSKSGRYSWSGLPVPKVKNYNRFGQKVFEKSNYVDEFTGVSNTGSLIMSQDIGLPEGVYYYLATLDDLELEYTGFLFLDR